MSDEREARERGDDTGDPGGMSRAEFLRYLAKGGLAFFSLLSVGGLSKEAEADPDPSCQADPVADNCDPNNPTSETDYCFVDPGAGTETGDLCILDPAGLNEIGDQCVVAPDGSGVPQEIGDNCWVVGSPPMEIGDQCTTILGRHVGDVCTTQDTACGPPPEPCDGLDCTPMMDSCGEGDLC